MAGAVNNFSPSQNTQSLGSSFWGYNNQGGQGVPVARSEIDAQRMGLPRTPSAEYPDGYLGTIRSRRDDRLLDSLKTRVNQKAYQRGVHRGERVDQSAYFWPQELSADRGIKTMLKASYDPVNQTMMSKRNAPQTRLAPAPHLVNDGKANVRHDGPGEISPSRYNKFNSLKPGWK